MEIIMSSVPITTQEIEEAVRALPRVSELPVGERLAAREANREAQADLENRWNQWMNAEYLHDFSANTIDALNSRAWDEGHSNGYAEVERVLQELAEFARMILSNEGGVPSRS